MTPNFLFIKHEVDFCAFGALSFLISIWEMRNNNNPKNPVNPV